MDRKGFTLTEILIVFAIMAVLSAVALLQYRGFKVKAYDEVALYDLKNLINDELAYYSINQTFVPFSTSDLYPDGRVVVGSFVHKYLSPQVRAVAKVCPLKSCANFCTKHALGSRIFGYETETGTIYYKESATGYLLKDSDCPQATLGADFKGWKVLSRSN